MGFSVQEKHQYVPNGGNICTKRMVNNIVHSLNAINTTMNSSNNSLFNHFRSWQRSRKMKMLNKNQNLSSSFVDQQQQHLHHRGQLSPSPMNNLCYQSVSINDLEQANNIKNPIQPPSTMTTVKNYYCPTAMMMKTNRAKSTNSIVSFKNKGDGKIVLNVKNNHQVMLNDNQLYSMDIGHQSSSFQNELASSNRSPSAISDFSSFYMSLEPPNDQYNKIIAPNDPLGNENWYYGSINREQAIRLVQNCPTGSFVVRKSSSNDGCYALTVRVPYDYNHTGVSHYLILQTSDEQYKIKGFNKEFHSISSLITHHSIMKEQLPCTLRLLLSDNSNTKTILLSSNNNNNINNIKKSKCQSFYNLNSSQIYCKNSKSKISNYNSYNTIRPSALNVSNSTTTISCNDDRMVDVDLDPTYQRILENFRKVMAHCNN